MFSGSGNAANNSFAYTGYKLIVTKSHKAKRIDNLHKWKCEEAEAMMQVVEAVLPS